MRHVDCLSNRWALLDLILWSPVCGFFPWNYLLERAPRPKASINQDDRKHSKSCPLLPGGSMVLSGISCFFLWFGTSESMMIGMLCLYNGLTISAWNSLDVVTVELYPTDRR